MRYRARIQWIWLWPVAFAASIFLMSCQSHPPSPSGIPDFDKMAHFSVFGLLGTLIYRIRFRPESPVKAFLLTILLVSLYGASDEFHQSFTPGRDVDVFDWVTDTLGGAFAVTLYALWPAYRRVLEYPLFARRSDNALRFFRDRTSSETPYGTS